MRTIIDLTQKQINALDALKERTSLPRTELIRRAVDEYLAKQIQNAGKRPGFGVWKAKGVDGLGYQQALRGDWDS